jgi:hypothetical protein
MRLIPTMVGLVVRQDGAGDDETVASDRRAIGRAVWRRRVGVDVRRISSTRPSAMLPGLDFHDECAMLRFHVATIEVSLSACVNEDLNVQVSIGFSLDSAHNTSERDAAGNLSEATWSSHALAPRLSAGGSSYR